MNRNSTNYPSLLIEKLRKLKYTEGSYLSYYQFLGKLAVTDSQFANGSRGILFFWGMGMGKTREAASIAVEMKKTQFRDVILFCQKSLHNNFRTEVEKQTKLDGSHKLDKEFVTYLSSDAFNVGSKITQNHFDNKLLIIDEAHNFAKAVINAQDVNSNAKIVYEAIMRATNLKIILMTGTPCAKNPFELVVFFNMLTGVQLLPSDYETFETLYIRDGQMINKEYFQNRLFGLISYIDSGNNLNVSDMVESKIKNEHFPEERPLIIEKVPMTNIQFRQYLVNREAEELEFTGFKKKTSSLSLPRSMSSSTHKVKSRMVSIWYDDQNQPKIDLIVKRVLTQPGIHLIYSQFNKEGLLKIAAALTRAGVFPYESIDGFASEKHNKQLREKIEIKSDDTQESLLNLIDVETLGGNLNLEQTLGGKKYEIKDKSVNLIDDLIEDEIKSDNKDEIKNESMDDLIEDKSEIKSENKIEDVQNDNSNPNTKLKYVIHSGETKQQLRPIIISALNADENKYGENIKAILISKTGAEGLDLKNIQYVHIVESYWDQSRISQVIARAVRLDSHIALPKDKHWVQPYLYLAVDPENGIQTVDEQLYDNAIKQEALNNQFRDSLKEISIECAINKKCKCRVCIPTGQFLFTSSPATDVTLPNNCMNQEEKEVQAKELEYNGQKYYFNDDKFYEFSDEYGAFIEIKQNTDLYYILKELNKI